MKKLISFAALALLLLATGACQRSTDQAKATYCADLAAYGQAVAGMKALTATSTVQQAKEALRSVEQAYANLKQSSAALRTTKVDVLGQELQTLQQTINAIRTANENSLRYVAARSWPRPGSRSRSRMPGGR